MESLLDLVTQPQFWIVACAALLAATIQSGIGMGYTPILAPFALLFLDPKSSLQAIIVLSLMSSAMFLRNTGHCLGDRYFRCLCLGALFGLPLGVWLLRIASIEQIKLAAAVFVTLAGLQALRPPSARRVPELFVASATGFVSGTMTASMGMSSPPAAWGLLISGADGTRLRVLVGTYLALVHIGAILTTTISGSVFDLTPATVAALALPTVAGTVLGKRWGKRVSPPKLKRYVAWLILFCGISLFAGMLVQYPE
jgi:uncharacterized protein